MINICALLVMAISLLMDFKAKREDRYIVSSIYMIVAWLMLIYGKLP
jgi:hypothetical protein